VTRRAAHPARPSAHDAAKHPYDLLVTQLESVTPIGPCVVHRLRMREWAASGDAAVAAPMSTTAAPPRAAHPRASGLRQRAARVLIQPLKESDRHPNVVVVLDWVEELKRLRPTK